MSISCVIPTCNRSELLLESINSALKQTHQPLEIIVVNNGDKPIVLPSEIKNKISLFDIIPFAGVSQARNFGASVARGDYIAFLDDDDLWNKDYLKNVSEVLAGEICVLSRLDKIIDGKIEAFKNSHNRISINNLLVKNPGATGSNIVISKSLFFEVGGYDPYLPPSEDKSLVLEILLKGKAVITLPDNQALLRVHGGERLTDSHKVAQGVLRFTKKYSHLMNTRQKLKNWNKIYYQRYKSGKKIFAFHFFVTKLLLQFF